MNTQSFKPVSFTPVSQNNLFSPTRSPIRSPIKSTPQETLENTIFANNLPSSSLPLSNNNGNGGNALELLSFSNILNDEIPEIKNILKQYYSVGTNDQLITALKKDQRDLFSKCKNKFTSGGVPIVDLNQFNGLSSEDNYCFDVADISNRFENGNFINPFTGKFFSDDFIRAFQTKIRSLYARNISFESVSNLINHDTIQRLKLRLILQRSEKTPQQIKDIIDWFFKLDDKALNIFIARNLRANPIPVFKTFLDKQKFALDNWIIMSWAYLNEQTKAKTTGPFSFLFG